MVVAATVSPAWAGSAASAPVVVVPFSGIHGDEPQAAVTHALGTRAAVASASELSTLKPYVTVLGAVEKAGGHSLKLTVRIIVEQGNEQGGEVARIEVPITVGRHLQPDQLRKLGADVDAAVTRALEAPPPAPKPATPAPDVPAPQSGDVEKAPLTGELEHWNGKRPTARAPRGPSLHLPAVPRPSYYPYVVGRAGALVTSRALNFNPLQTPTFHGGTAGGIHAEVELYPLAFLHAVKHGRFAGLGGWFTVDKPFWPTTTFDLLSSQYDTDELRLEGGARWRFVLRRLPPFAELTVFGGAGLHTFTIAKNVDPTTGRATDAGPPDARYVYGIVGLEARVALVQGRVAPFLRIGYQYVPDAGPTENLDEYGLSSTHGFQLRAGLEARVWRKVMVGVSAFLDYYALSFENNRTTARHANDATDQYYGGIFTVGYAL
jgi:hypothetical protein